MTLPAYRAADGPICPPGRRAVALVDRAGAVADVLVAVVEQVHLQPCGSGQSLPPHMHQGECVGGPCLAQCMRVHLWHGQAF